MPKMTKRVARHAELAEAAKKIAERAAASPKGAGTAAFFLRVAKAHESRMVAK